MLTRPLSYKGPTDHLSQFFSIETLYQGLLMLISGELVEWQHIADESQVNGFFLDEGKIKKVTLEWPLSQEQAARHCHCNTFNQRTPNSCIHTAALAIESKTRLERLPAPLKPTTQYTDDRHYFNHWIHSQSFDPFPNMARHRVVYLLDLKDGHLWVTTHKAYLTQQDEYQKKDGLPFNVTEKKSLPKFVTLTDQWILAALLAGSGDQNLETNSYRFIETDVALLRLMLSTQRCFWKSCHRQPLTMTSAINPASEWIKLFANSFLDKKSSQIVECLNKNRQENLEHKDTEHLLKSLNDTQLSPTIEGRLSISSHQLVIDWPRGHEPRATAVAEIDIARVGWRHADKTFQLSDIKQLKEQGIDLPAAIEDSVFSMFHLLDALPSIASEMEPILANQFDIGDRLLNGDLSHWFVLFNGLHRMGWKIEFDRQFRLNQKKVNQWYSRVISPADSNRKYNGKQAQNGVGASKANNVAESINKNQQLDFFTDEFSGGNDSSINDSSEWFDLELGIIIDGHPVNILPYIVEAMSSGRWEREAFLGDDTKEKQLSDRTITLDDGTRVLLEGSRLAAIISNLVELTETRPLADNRRLRLPTNQFSRIGILSQDLGEKTLWQNADWLKKKVHQLKQLNTINKITIPRNVHANLRDYQAYGVSWLQTLSAQSLNGILADDMGLGKTLQTLAHIQIEKNMGRMKTPSLVVAPTSLIGNWVNEARKFTPELKVIEWIGANRKRKAHWLKETDLIITSYGTLMRDKELLNRLQLHILVLDEAQTIKNASSRIANLTYAMQSRHRLCLTGTPLENHLGELWSLFHFLMPGFLGTHSQFKRLFQWPIEKENNRIRQKVLSTRVAPFMLRRTKSKVAADLPSKTEINEWITLSPIQSDRYETIRLAMLEQVQKAISTNSQGRNQLLIGNALLRLRQVCCHTKLFDSSNDKKVEHASAKLDWLNTMLPDMIANQQKVLIFSSFTQMLGIIAQSLDEKGITNIQLTGKSKNRDQLVEKFQRGEVDVFLISLKAGGAGLNLTRADTVIHFDPWWNPAAESQASDRAHRIGQNKPVFIYKLITKGTVEEKIQSMQKQKAALADEIFRSSENGLHFEKNDWQSLLAPIDSLELDSQD